MKKLRLLCFTALLILSTAFLVGCSAFAQVPPDQAIKLAIAQQLTHTQNDLAQTLGLQDEAVREPNFKINQLTVKSREKLTNPEIQQRYPGELYKVRGAFEATLTAFGQKTKQSSSFEIYLAHDPQDLSEVDTWFLLKPDASR